MIVTQLVLSFAALAQAVPSPPKAIEREGWFSPDDVPLDVTKAHKGGTVGYELKVGETGKPTDCKVTLSSGFPGLDAATCAALMERASFQPATDVQGKSVASSYRSRATFEPPVIDKKIHEGPSLFVTRLTLNPDGSLVECGTEGDDPDPITVKACERILQGEKGAFFKELSSTHSVFRIANAWTPPMYRPRPALRSWGERLAYRTDIEVFNPDKLNATPCYTLQSDGRADLLGKPCDGKQPATKADIRRAHPGITFRWESAIFAVKR